AGFDELESGDIEDVLASHTEELTNKNLQQLTEHEDLQQLVDSGKIEDAEDEEVQDAKPRELPTSVLSSILREVDTQLQRLEDNDYNAERSRIAVRGAKSFLAPYEQLLCERRKTAKQQTLDVFFKSTPKKQTEDTEPQPSTSGIRRFFLPSHATKTAPDDDNTDDNNSQLSA
ncbi:putative Tigger transposable element-derived protein 1-like 331, partial [Homarus americanus]